MNIVPQTESQMLIVPPSIALTADEPIRLWHDDVRKPPTGWIWARTNAAAKELLTKYNVEVISLDHDLGGHNLDPDAPDTWLYKGPSTEETGLALVDWMIFEQRVPQTVYIHSWNGPGAQRMKKTLIAKGYLNVYIQPYEAPARPVCARCGETSCWRVGGLGGCQIGDFL
jgi:hypothetical protein